MRIYNLMPVMRVALWSQIRANLELGRLVGHDVQWRPVLFEGEWENLDRYQRNVLRGHWIWPVVIAFRDGQFAMTQKLNAALQLTPSLSDSWVFTGSDDNLIPRRVWVSWLKPDPKPVLVVSCRRGQRPGKSGHGVEDLIASPENMKIGQVTGEQYLVRADIMRDRLLAQGRELDGMLIQELWEERPQDFEFFPEVFIPFNALEEDRWDPPALASVLDQTA